MSVELLRKQVARFLESIEPEVLCIRGEWGVGKSFAWRAFLDEAKVAKKIALGTYSYVSLFGVDSLERFKYAIFENTIDRESIGTEPSLETLRTHTVDVSKRLGRTAFPLLLQWLPLIRNAADAIQSLSLLSITDRIICIDDLERKGTHLSTKDILGLISHLKEQKRCKIVLILNEEELANTDKDEFKRYGEKVIDISLLFAPSAAECADIAIRGHSQAQKLLSRNTSVLGIANIRVIKKIERLVLRAEELLAKFDEGVLRQAVNTLTLLGWSVYSHNEPLREFITKKRGKGLYGLQNEKNLTEDEKAWDGLLDEYDFRIMDKFDLALLEGIDAGFFDEAKLTTQAQELEDKVNAHKLAQSFEHAWKLYHESFDNNEDEVVKEITDSFRTSVRFVTPTNLNGTVRLLKDLGHAEEAAAAINYYIDNRPGDRDLFDLDDSPFGGDIDDPDVRKAFDQKYNSFRDDRAPVDVLLRIARELGWSRDDIALLSKLSVDDFYNLFKTQGGENLSRIVRTSLKFGSVQPNDKTTQDISDRAKAALQKIGKESKINGRRVGKYGIVIGE